MHSNWTFPLSVSTAYGVLKGLKDVPVEKWDANEHELLKQAEAAIAKATPAQKSVLSGIAGLEERIRREGLRGSAWDQMLAATVAKLKD